MNIFLRLITRLLTSEKVADRRGIGVWERDTWVESVSSIPSQTGQLVRSNPITKLLVSYFCTCLFFSFLILTNGLFLFQILLYHVLRDLSVLLYHLASQGYHLGVTASQYAVVGYHRFAKGVDRLTGIYTSSKNRLSGPKAVAKKE